MNKDLFISKAVVTGAGGFIGRALVDYLLKNGTEVIAVDRVPLNFNCKSLALDLTARGGLDEFLDNNTVLFHLAAKANVADSVKDPRSDFENTLCNFFEVLESARKADCQLIFPSTASIFDVSNQLPLSEKGYVGPTSPYAAAKVAGEAYCVAYSRLYGLNVKIARMFSIYGIGMNRFAIHDLIRKIQKNNKELAILGDGNQIRDYLYIDDAICGLVMLAVKGIAGEDYNLASGIAVKLIDLARLIAELMNVPDIKIITTGQSFLGDVPRWYADTSKIKGIGFCPEVSFKDGLMRTINWLTNSRETK